MEDISIDEVSMKLLSAYVSQIQSALKISEILAEHADEDTISPDNIILGLIYRLMVPMTEKEMKESVDITNEILDPSSSEEEDLDGEDLDEEDEEDLEQKKPRKIKTNHCNCEICMKARVCLINYPKYESPDIFAEKFHNSIKHTCERHKLLL
jgi:hypothetical protein